MKIKNISNHHQDNLFRIFSECFCCEEFVEDSRCCCLSTNSRVIFFLNNWVTVPVPNKNKQHLVNKGIGLAFMIGFANNICIGYTARCIPHKLELVPKDFNTSNKKCTVGSKPAWHRARFPCTQLGHSEFDRRAAPIRTGAVLLHRFQEGSYAVIWCNDMGVSKNRGNPPQIIHFSRVFHYKPSILGYPYFWKHPYVMSAFFSSWRSYPSNRKVHKAWKTWTIQAVSLTNMAYALIKQHHGSYPSWSQVSTKTSAGFKSGSNV